MMPGRPPLRGVAGAGWLLSGWLALSPTLTGAAGTPERFYERGAEGWFWYAPEPPAAPAPETPPDPEPSPAPPPVAEAPSPPEAPELEHVREPAPLSAAWLRANLEHYQLQAIDDPSPTRVALYLYLQRLALDKASRFSEVYQRVVQSDPYLDETTRRPVGNYANLLNRQAGAQRTALLRQLAGQAGLWFFHRADCPYCEAQAPVLGLIQAQTGLPIQAIALDGQALASGHFPRVHRDTGQAARLGVVSTPALFLVRPPDGIVPVAQGLVSLSELEQRLLRAAHTAGWIDEDAYARTRPLVTELRLDRALGDLERVPEDPERFLAWLRTHAAGEGALHSPALSPTD